MPSTGAPDGSHLWVFNFPPTLEHEAWQVLGKEESGRMVGLILLFPDSQAARITTLANEKWKNWQAPRLVGETLVWNSLNGRAQGSFGPLNGTRPCGLSRPSLEEPYSCDWALI